MKKLLFTILLTATILTTFAQNNSTPSKVYYNEFGVDITGFLKQYLNFNQSQNFQNYIPTYYLTYRRHLKYGNIRAAIGGNFSNEEIPSGYTNDPNNYKHNTYTFNARVGWEFTNDLTKRWQVYYGLDFRPSITYNKDDAQYWNAGYANGEETKSQNYGIAPLLGFRFKLTNRLSLNTEASFSINWQEYSTTKYYTPISSQFPNLPNENTPSTKRMYSNFSQPLMIILTFDL